MSDAQHEDDGELEEESEADDAFERERVLWNVLLDAVRTSCQSATEEVDIESVQKLAIECGLTVSSELTATEILSELLPLYHDWSRRLTRDGGHALNLPQSEGRVLLKTYIEVCPIWFLRMNAEGLLEAIEDKHNVH